MSEAASKRPLANKGFLSLVVTQFLGAGNDYLLKQVLTFGLAAAGIWNSTLGDGGQSYVAAVLALPFLLFSAVAGQLCDRYSKQLVAVRVKQAEFLIVMAARRGVSFLQKQAEVDPDRIGAFGHSMGGKLTVMLAGSDERIVAAAPSCGGGGSAPGDIRARANAGVRPRKSALWHRTIDDPPYLERITAPILYMGPQNDFNGILDNVYANWKRLGSKVVNYTVNPHMNHRATPEHVFPGMLFFEAHLKGAFDFPVTPELRVTLEEKDGIPRAFLVPDQPGRVAEVEIYYSVDSHILTRFWRTAIAEREGNSWSARLPVFSTGQPLFVMANVYYRLDHKVGGYRWMKKPPGTFGVSSGMRSFTPEQLASSGAKGNGKQNPMIEEEFSDYQDWYRLDWKNPHWWSVWTRKVKDPGFAAPAGARLLLDVKVEDDTTLFFG